MMITTLAMAMESRKNKRIAKQTAPKKGILVKEIPQGADIIFSSIRYVLKDKACLDKKGEVKKNFIGNRKCGKKIWSRKYGFTSPKQVFTMDIDTGRVTQITDIACYVDTVQVIDSHTIMIWAACRDTNRDRRISDKDKAELHILDLMTEKRECLTCGFGLESINNPDYSRVNEKIVFSARSGDRGSPQRIFVIDKDKNLSLITDDPDYMDFDCAWSEDGTKIVFNRLPMPLFKKPSQVWLMDADGGNVEKITDGGDNPFKEKPHRRYPIGTDADPDLSPDNKKIVFTRLRTGKENKPFGVWALLVIDLDTKELEVLDSQYTNMIPQWKSKGILLLRQAGTGRKPTDRKHYLCIYQNGQFKKLEEFPFDVYPMGGFGMSLID